ncbi:MAG: CopG family transcriptional regulator [Patescibacteria group bacterium]
MLKTYLYLPEELDKEINHLAKNQKRSKAEVIREALDSGIKNLRSQGSATSLLKLAEIGKKYNLRGPKNSSQRIDELLWSKDWSKDE